MAPEAPCAINRSLKPLKQIHDSFQDMPGPSSFDAVVSEICSVQLSQSPSKEPLSLPGGFRAILGGFGRERKNDVLAAAMEGV